MDRNNNIFEQLALATMDIEHPELGKNPFDELEQCVPDRFNQLCEDLFEKPGILYKVDRDLNTFCLRGVACHDMGESLQDLNHDLSLQRKLRIEEEDQRNDVHFFETSFDYASVIIDQIANKRVPIKEQLVCNISDPGFSWWLEHDKGSLTLHFRTPAVFTEGNIINLGPLGDSEMAHQMLNQALSYWSVYYGIGEFNSDYKSVQVNANGFNLEWFKAFSNLLITGENIFSINDFGQSGQEETLFYYFEELALIRKFWLQASEKIMPE